MWVILYHRGLLECHFVDADGVAPAVVASPCLASRGVAGEGTGSGEAALCLDELTSHVGKGSVHVGTEMASAVRAVAELEIDE